MFSILRDFMVYGICYQTQKYVVALDKKSHGNRIEEEVVRVSVTKIEPHFEVEFPVAGY